MIPEERQKGCESMNLTRISICRNQVFLGEGLEQRLSWKISETLAVQILELDGECYLLHVIQIMYHSSQARQPKNQTSKKNPEGFLTNSFVATLARSSSTLPVGFSFLHVVGRFKWSVRWDFTQFVEFGPWQVSQHRTLGARRHFFFGREGMMLLPLDLCWFCVRTQWEKREMNGIEDGDVVSGY